MIDSNNHKTRENFVPFTGILFVRRGVVLVPAKISKSKSSLISLNIITKEDISVEKNCVVSNPNDMN